MFGDSCRFEHISSGSTSPQSSEPESASTSSEITNSCSPSSTTEGHLDNAMYDKWLEAPEFVPSANKGKMKSYAQAVNAVTEDDSETKSELKLCPYAEMHGVCSYADGECSYLHGDICELCGNAALHPYNKDKRKTHTQVNTYLLYLYYYTFDVVINSSHSHLMVTI